MSKKEQTQNRLWRNGMARIPVMMEEERGQEGPAELLGITPK